jgi:hypothetical protein
MGISSSQDNITPELTIISFREKVSYEFIYISKIVKYKLGGM